MIPKHLWMASLSAETCGYRCKDAGSICWCRNLSSTHEYYRFCRYLEGKPHKLCFLGTKGEVIFDNCGVSTHKSCLATDASAGNLYLSPTSADFSIISRYLYLRSKCLWVKTSTDAHLQVKILADTGTHRFECHLCTPLMLPSFNICTLHETQVTDSCYLGQVTNLGHDWDPNPLKLVHAVWSPLPVSVAE